MTPLTELSSARTASLPSATIASLWKTLKFVSDPAGLTNDQVNSILPILEEEARARELRQIRYLLQ